jgi:outer membrane receptor protein involved in Fe transport
VVALAGGGVAPALCAEATPAAGERPAPAPPAATADDEERKAAPARDGQDEAPARVFGEEIVVTATRSERAAGDLPVSVSVVSREEIARTPALQLDDVLRTVPGLNLPADGSAVTYPSNNLLSIRGLGGVNRALVLVDGIPLNDPMFGNINWSDVQLGAVERVEVVRGGAGSLYGGLAMGGTVHVISRPAVDGEVLGDLSYGSYDTRRGSLSVGHRVSPRVVVGAGFDRSESEGHHRIPEDRRQPIDIPSAWDQLSSRVEARLEVSPAVHGFVRASHATADLSLGTPYSATRRESSRLASGLEVAGVAGGDLSVHLFWQDQTFDSTNVRILAGGASGFRANANRAPAETVGGAVEWSRRLSDRVPQVGLGVDLRSSRAASHRRNLDPAGALLSTEHGGGEQDTVGVFGQAIWAPTRRLEILAGARLDSWRNHSGYTLPPSDDGVTYPGRSAIEASPRLAARYDLGRGLGLRGAAYGAFGPPVLRDLYRSSAFRNQEQLPNPRLEPERLVGGEAGLDLDRGRLRGHLNAFHNEIDDVITEVVLRTEPVLSIQPQNVGTARSRGAELFGEAFLDERWSVSASYTWTDAETVGSPGRPELVGKRLAEVPEEAAAAAVTFRAAGGGAASARAVHAGRAFADAENTLAYDGRTVVDLFASWPVTGALELYGAVTNAFDEEYLADVSTALRRGTPRQVRLGLRLRTALPGSAAAAAAGR